MQPKPQQLPPGYVFVQQQGQPQLPSPTTNKTDAIHDILNRLSVVESMSHEKGNTAELVKLLEMRLQAILAL